MKKGKRYIVVTYYAYNDPLFQGLLWRVIQRLKTSEHHITLITLEHDQVDESQRTQLLKEGVDWKPVNFQFGTGLRLKKVLMMLRIQMILFFAVLFRRPTKIFSSGSLAASLCWPVSATFGVEQVVYAFEPHSEFLLDQNKCTEHSFSFRILRFFETRVMKGKSILMTGTHAMINRIKESAPSAKVHFLPTHADEDLFQFSEKKREEIRNDLCVENRTVIAYVGKFGDLYLGKELIAFFAELLREDRSCFFLVLTPNDHSVIAGWFDECNVSSDHYWLGTCPLSELPGYLSAADVGVVAYADLPSRKYTSPTKSGNYLLCGLPFIVQKGTSEDDLVVEKNGVGVVVQNFGLGSAKDAYKELQRIRQEEASVRRRKCRDAGMHYRGMRNAINLYTTFFKH